MSLSLSTAICLIACHGGPADHFSTFAEHLVKKGYDIKIYATGPALKKIQDRKLEVTSFSLENGSEEGAAIMLAEKCANAAVVMTDVGHAFDIPLQQALRAHAPQVMRLAYYDNPEPYVPGGYSAIAAKVMSVAHRVLFANANLAQENAFFEGLPAENKIGVGYYPIDQAEKIAKRRKDDHDRLRAQFFSRYGLEDRGQKVLVYVGGNNDEYFSKAFPAFLQYLGEVEDLSNFVVLLQQHPGAKEKNIDCKLGSEWIDQQGLKINFFVSELNSEDAQVVADAMLYYQTSMGPQFVLAGIPTIQVGHHVYEDILVKNQLCSVATNGEDLLKALSHLGDVRGEKSSFKQGLGLRSDWMDQLERALNRF